MAGSNHKEAMEMDHTCFSLPMATVAA